MLMLDNVRYRYGRKAPDILLGVSQCFEPGHMYAIMGASGTGKTTLLSLMAKLDHPTAGNIIFNGRNLRSINSDLYRSKHVSVIFQQYNLLLNHSALDNILLVLHLSERGKNLHQRATNLLNEVHIPPEKHHKATRYLSGGEQQRVAIARALASGADVVLADEPTGNLDPKNAENVLSLFEGLKTKYGKCVVFVTHSMELAKRADRIVLL